MEDFYNKLDTFEFNEKETSIENKIIQIYIYILDQLNIELKEREKLNYTNIRKIMKEWIYKKMNEKKIKYEKYEINDIINSLDYILKNEFLIENLNKKRKYKLNKY